MMVPEGSMMPFPRPPFVNGTGCIEYIPVVAKERPSSRTAPISSATQQWPIGGCLVLFWSARKAAAGTDTRDDARRVGHAVAMDEVVMWDS